MVTSGQSEFESNIPPKFLRGYLERTSYLCGLKDFKFNLEKVVDPEVDATLFGLNEDLYKRTPAFVHPLAKIVKGVWTATGL